MIKALVFDFDGTLVTHDLLDYVCEINNKKDVSQQINLAFQKGEVLGNDALIKRINLLEGISLTQLNQYLQNTSFLRTGAIQVFNYAKACNLTTIINSGNIIPILNFYKNILGADYILGNYPFIHSGVISRFPKEQAIKPHRKYSQLAQFLTKLLIKWSEIISIGNGPDDVPIFKRSAIAISIGNNNEVARHSQYHIDTNMAEIIPIINKHLSNTK